MKIASYNIWNSHAGMPERKSQIISELLDVNADILCLQEVADFAIHSDLLSALGYSYSHMNEAAGTSLYSKYRLSPVFDTEYSASVLIRAESTLFVTDLHLPWKSASAREKAIADIIRESERISYADTDYALMTGDFNCSENSSVHRFLLGDQSLCGLDAYYFDLAEAWTDITGIPAEPTLDFHNNPRWRGMNTIEKNQRFDRILLKNPYPNEYPSLLGITLFGTSVDPETKLSASDHYGIAADIEF